MRNRMIALLLTTLLPVACSNDSSSPGPDTGTPLASLAGTWHKVAGRSSYDTTHLGIYPTALDPNYWLFTDSLTVFSSGLFSRYEFVSEDCATYSYHLQRQGAVVLLDNALFELVTDSVAFSVEPYYTDPPVVLPFGAVTGDVRLACSLGVDTIFARDTSMAMRAYWARDTLKH